MSAWRGNLRKGWITAGILLLLALLVGGAGAHADGPTTLYPSANERLGVGVLGDIRNYDLSPLHAGWYVNWGTSANLINPEGMDFAQIIRVGASIHPSLAQIREIAGRNPGSLWLVGNEPDCIWQDNVWPETYAEQYHDIYSALKEADPTCQVAIGGVVQATPLRLQWLDRVWNWYRARYGETMPVDVWNVHNFILQERRGSWGCEIPPGINATAGMLYGIDDHDNMTYFRQQIEAFRRWMAEKGQQNKPLIVSEYGILFHEGLGYDYERVRRFMLATFNYFMNATDPEIGYPADGYRLVQRWAWYSLDDPSFEQEEYTTWSALYDPFPPYAIRPLGEEFGRYAGALVVPYVDLVPARFQLDQPAALVYGEPASFTAHITIQNRGNTPSDGPIPVQVQQEDAAGAGTVTAVGTVPALPRRYAGTAVLPLTWQSVITGPVDFAVYVNPGGSVPEWDLSNNTAVQRLDVWADLALDRVGAVSSGVPFVPGERTPVQLKALVRNASRLDIRDVEVCFWVRPPGESEVPAGCASLPYLAAGQTAIVERDWTVERAGLHPLRAVVDPNGAVSERFEGNNQALGSFLAAPHRVFWPLLRGGAPGS
ncbi:MAG: CARDB domain-containing protein [Anaerolineae bacterium]